MENQYLIQARLDRFWSIEEASKRVGVRKRAYERWEKGVCVPYLHNLGMLLKAFEEKDPEQLGYLIENKRIRLKQTKDADLPTERTPTLPEASAPSARRELLPAGQLPPAQVQRIGETVFLTITLPFTEFQALGEEAQSGLETPATPSTPQTPSSISLQPLTSSPSQSVDPQGTINGEASTQKPGVRNLRDSSLVSSKDIIPSLKAYSGLSLGEATICQQQRDISRTIDQWSTMNDEHITDPDSLTRRDLIALASVSFPLLSNVRRRQFTASMIEEFLSETTASVTTCWYLLQGDGLPIVELTLPQYLPELVEVVKCSSLYRQRAAYLAAQGFLLLSLTNLHRVHYTERVVNCQKAVTYAHESGDLTLLVTSLGHLGDAFLINRQLDESLKTYLQAEHYSKSSQISGFLRSKVLGELSHPYAKQGNNQEVVRCLGEAYATFTEADSETPVFLLADYGRYQTILFEGLSTIDLGSHAKKQGKLDRAQKYWKDAAEKLDKMEQLPSSVLVPTRIAAEVVIAQALAHAKARNMEGFITSFEKGTRLAKELGSEKRKQEAREALNAALGQWQGDQRITGLWELLV